MKKWIILIIVIIPILSNAQIASKIKATHEVFSNLVKAYANGKGAPDLKISPLKGAQIIAEYSTINGVPFIQIDEKLINICYSLGKDSLNALAFILSHELSHYYKDDNWCMDYAGLKFKSNPAFAKAMKNSSKYNVGKEAAADKEGLIYAAVAGYSPFAIFNTLLDNIYSKYSLIDNLQGYPSKKERKEINNDAKKDAKEWLRIFNLSLNLIDSKKYTEAIDSLTYLSKKFPSREVYNNLGIAKTRKALLLKPKTYEEVHFPERFLYPLEVENKTRLEQDDTRGMDEQKIEEMNKLLKSAQKDFQEAVRIDPEFIKGYINLSCVFDLLYNPLSAIGQIMQLSEENKNTIEVKKILAIAYYHIGQIENAKKIWSDLKIGQ
jgi:tetratricopeptide (TPR) repeat protein